MIALYIAPFYIGIIIFQLIKKNNHFKNNKLRFLYLIVSGIVLLCGPLSIVTGFLLDKEPYKTIFSKLGNLYLGFSLYLFFAILVCDIFRLIIKLILKEKYNLKLARNISNIIVIIFSLTMTIYGSINAKNIKVVDYYLETNKDIVNEQLNIVQVSDIHLGYNFTVKDTENLVNKINELNPDIVVFTGDIFDNEFKAIENPEKIAELLNSINSKYGKYAVYGNHDIEEKILCGFTFSNKDKTSVKASDEMLDFISKTGINFLYDEKVEINSEEGKTICYIYGRPDYEKPNFGNSTRISAKDITKGLDLSNFVVCLDHEPRELEELALAGVDLDLSGHTHNGQIWPGTITINLFWDVSYGLKTIENMNLIVSSGVGCFGPNMRIVADPEIVNITIKSK